MNHYRSRTQRSRRRGLRSSGRIRRDGLATVEFAIVAPLFFMLVLGGIELGRALMVQQVLTNAARVGARTAVTLAGTETAAIASASDFAAGAAVNGVEVSVSPNPSTASAGDMISVTVSVPFANVSWNPAPWFMGAKTLTSTAVMRKEGFE